MSPRTPVAGIAYGLWLRGRLGLLASVAATLALAAIAALAAPIPRVLVTFAAVLAFGSGLAYLVRIVTYGSADLSTPESGYPRHTFVLPVRARALVAVPMFCGCLVAAAFWAALAPLAFSALGQHVPRLWPATTVAAVVAWLQAVSWSPFRWPYVRVFLAIGVLAVFVAGGVVAQACHIGDLAIAALTVALGALACPVAIAGLTRARGGDGAEPFARTAPAQVAARRRPPFGSAARAQLWLELRRNAWFTPLVTAGCALSLGTALAVMKHGRPTVLLPSSVPPGAWPVLILLGLPMFVAMVNSGGFGKFDLWANQLTFPAFLLARPISTAMIVGTKLRSAAVAAAWGWGVVLMVLGAYAWVPGTYDSKRSWAAVLMAHATSRSAATACLGVVVLFLWTWKMLVRSLWVTLLGRPWIAVVLPSLEMLAAGAIAWAGYRAYADPKLHALGWPWLRSVVIALAALKLANAVIVFAVIRRNALMTPAAITRIACIWLAIVAGLVAALFLVLPVPKNLMTLLVATAVLFVPLVRPALAVLALQRNRHR